MKPPRPEDALAANVAGATDGLVYRVDMSMGAGRPYTEVVMTVGFPGPFMLITHNPKARLRCMVQQKPNARIRAGTRLVAVMAARSGAAGVWYMGGGECAHEGPRYLSDGLCCTWAVSSHSAVTGFGGQGAVRGAADLRYAIGAGPDARGA